MASKLNPARLLSAAVGAATAVRYLNKVVPEGHARTAVIGFVAGGATIATLDEVGVEVLAPLRAGFNLLVGVGDKTLKEIAPAPAPAPTPAPEAPKTAAAPAAVQYEKAVSH